MAAKNPQASHGRIAKVPSGQGDEACRWRLEHPGTQPAWQGVVGRGNFLTVRLTPEDSYAGMCAFGKNAHRSGRLASPRWEQSREDGVQLKPGPLCRQALPARCAN